MGSTQVPKEVAHEVAAFVWARARENAPAQVSAEDLDRRWAEAGMVRDYQKALDRGRAVTADNLAYTLLMAAARYAGHRDYQARWRAWTPFGDLTPGANLAGPTTRDDT